MTATNDFFEGALNEEGVKDAVVAICSVLYVRGIREVSVGGLMRLLGIEDTQAIDHDDEFLILDEEFEKVLLLQPDEIDLDLQVPAGTTLH
jgi:hypothetical protein